MADNSPSGDGMDPTASLPVRKEPGVISLNVLSGNLTMHGFPDWRKRFESWSEVPAIRLACVRLFPFQPFTSETVELLIAWFQEHGLTADQARHLPLAEAVRRLTLHSKPPAETPQGEGGTPPADPFADLREFARGNLKGQERAVIEALCDAGGELPLADLAVKDDVGWDDASKGFEGAQRRLNPKIKKLRRKLMRQDNAARLVAIPAEDPRKNG